MNKIRDKGEKGEVKKKVERDRRPFCSSCFKRPCVLEKSGDGVIAIIYHAAAPYWLFSCVLDIYTYNIIIEEEEEELLAVIKNNKGGVGAAAAITRLVTAQIVFLIGLRSHAFYFI